MGCTFSFSEALSMADTCPGPKSGFLFTWLLREASFHVWRNLKNPEHLKGDFFSLSLLQDKNFNFLVFSSQICLISQFGTIWDCFRLSELFGVNARNSFVKNLGLVFTNVFGCFTVYLRSFGVLELF